MARVPGGNAAQAEVAVTNAVRHGAGRGRLRIWSADGVLRCEVTDDGPSHTDAAAAADPARWNIEPGHGLWVVRQVADRTSLHGGPSGTVVAVSFTLGPPASAGTDIIAVT